MSAADSEQPAPAVAYLAADGLLEPVLDALGKGVVGVRGRLVLASAPSDEASWWAANTWLAPQWRRIASIGDGAKWLRSMQRNWACYTTDWFRRAELIIDKLPPLKAKPRPFPFELPDAPMGNWTLWDKDLMLASARCSSPFQNGEIEFEDDKTGPPSRAFKKLQEALTVLRARPQPGERCLDLGACPGGWTWVLQKLSAEVIAVDKAPLDPKVLALPGVTQRVESAFGLEPRDIGPVDWLFSDVICYPRRLLELIVRWRDSGMCRRFVCTIKFQGADEHAIAHEFAALPGARLMHLHHNKHELTFALLDD